VFPFLFLLDAACVDTSLMMGVSRLPVYFLGMYVGKEAAEGRKPSKRHILIALGLMLASMVAFYFLVTRWPQGLRTYGFWWHPFLLSTLGGLYMMTWMLEKLEKTAPGKALCRGLRFLGGKSFEIYLWHILIYEVGLWAGVRGWTKWILLALCGLTAGSLYSLLVDRFTAWRKRRP